MSQECGLLTGVDEPALGVQKVESEENSPQCGLEQILREAVLGAHDHIVKAVPHGALDQTAVVATFSWDYERVQSRPDKVETRMVGFHLADLAAGLVLAAVVLSSSIDLQSHILANPGRVSLVEVGDHEEAYCISRASQTVDDIPKPSLPTA